MTIQKFNYLDIEGNVISSKNIEYDENGKRTDKIFWENYVKEKEKPIFYHLDELSKLKYDDTVFLVEGEKDVETIRSLGFNSTTANNSSYKFNELKQLSYFKNLNVIIIPDLDSTGWKYAYTAGTALKKSYFPNSVKILDLSDLAKKFSNDQDIPKGYDITDFLSDATVNGTYTKNQIFDNEVLSIVEELSEFDPETIPDDKKCENAKNDKKIEHDKRVEVTDSAEYQTMETPPLEWIAEDLIPTCNLIQLSAKPKCGKSSFALQLASAVVSDSDTFLDKAVNVHGSVIYFDLENSHRIRKNRLIELFGSAENIPSGINFRSFPKTATPKILEDDGFMYELEKAYQEVENPVLIIVDPLTDIKTEHNKNQIQHESKEMDKLHQFVDNNQISILIINHNKKQNEEDPFDNAVGSTGVNAKFDTLMSITFTNNAFGKEENYRLHIKSREIGLEQYDLEKNGFQWIMKGETKALSKEKQRKGFNNNPYYKAIKLGIERSKNKVFKTTSGDFRKLLAEVQEIEIDEVEHAKTVTSKITSLTSSLKYFGNIKYSTQKPKGHTMTHVFEYNKENFLQWDSFISVDSKEEYESTYYYTKKV